MPSTFKLKNLKGKYTEGILYLKPFSNGISIIISSSILL